MEGATGYLFAFCGLSIFLLVGKLARVKIKILQTLFLPSAIIGGFVAMAFGRHALDVIPHWMIDRWAELPGMLINVVFASLFLGVTLPKPKELWGQGGSQLCFGMVMGVGQYFIALLTALLILGPLFGTPPIVAAIVEVGFSGGHGTAAGMTQAFADLGLPAGGALAQMSATVGMLVAVIAGIILINIAIRKGYCAYLNEQRGIPTYKKVGLIPTPSRYSIATATVATEVIEPLTFHFAIIAIAILLGQGMLMGVHEIHPIVSGFPLFPLAMIGGLIVQGFAAPLKVAHYFDRDTFDRILGFCLDVLILSAIASLRLDLFLANVGPFVFLMLTGIAWVVVCAWFIAPRMFPRFWFERGITEFGMQTGVTAMGLLLLRLVDPKYKTGTATAFGFKQMIYEPFLGGGLLTATAPFIIIGLGPWPTVGIAFGIMILFVVIATLNGWTSLKPKRDATAMEIQLTAPGVE